MGAKVTLEQVCDATTIAVLNLLSTIKSKIRDLRRVERVMKASGFINSAPHVHRQPEVINGVSGLLG